MNKKQSFFIATPIYYVNDQPHLGHLYTTLAADVLARFYREKGEKVFFLTGTDEHGLKVAEAAQKAGLSPQAFADKISGEFKKAWSDLQISFDFFGRTTDPTHIAKVQKFLILVKNKGFLYSGDYSGLYCSACEEYKSPKELEGKNLCPLHKIKVDEVKEPVWFFKLSGFQKKLIDLIKSDVFLIEPFARKQEVLSFLKEPLQDVAISRSKVQWGIPLPWEKSQTVYVWVDALLNYFTFAQNHWPVDLHIIGKDILRFHAVIWPALLLAAGISLPKKIFVHGFFTIGGEKMSKTRGNVITPKELVDKFGLEAARYLVLALFPFGQDGDFAWKNLLALYRANLQNGLGNLLQRTITLFVQAKIKPKAPKTKIACGDAYLFLEKLDFYRSLKAINAIVEEANRYIDRTQPWRLLKEDRARGEKLEQILNSLATRLTTIATSLSPYMPETAEKILKQLTTLKRQPLFPAVELKV